ncbi:MAG TPA: transposase, partial [Chloroflexota bacterium]
DDLVPADHFYRHLDRVFDLTFIRDLVYSCYAADKGRPSVDPVVVFRLQLVMFFEGIRSDRQLLRLAADRLSVRWYPGYNLDEPLPDHSTLTRVRLRYGLAIFRRFFEAIVEQCQQAGLVWGRELCFDATQVQADASLDSLTARFAVDARQARQARHEREAQQGAQQAKVWHGLRRFCLRRLWRVNSEALMTAAGQNLKRLLARQGWGRRLLPSGAALTVANPIAGASVCFVRKIILVEAYHRSRDALPDTGQTFVATWQRFGPNYSPGSFVSGTPYDNSFRFTSDR